MYVNTQALVISALKYGDNSLIVKCYTRVAGLKSYLLKGILKSRKGKLRASYFQPLTLLELQAVHRDRDGLDYLNEAKPIHPYQSLHTDVVKTSIGLFLAEVLKSTLREEEANSELYVFLERSFLWLDAHPVTPDFHLLFLAQLSRYLGFAPDVSQAPVFNAQEGVFQQQETTVYCFELPPEAHFRKILTTAYDRATQLQATKKERTAALQLMLAYYQLHIQGFTIPKSLGVLQEVFG